MSELGELGTLYNIAAESLRPIEEEGRNLAYERDVENKLIEYRQHGVGVVCELDCFRVAVETLMEEGRLTEEEKREAEKVIPFITKLLDLFSDFEDRVYTCREEGIKKPSECRVVPPRELRDLDDLCRKVTGEGCVWLGTRVKEYSVAGYLNDLVSCLHKALIYFEEKGKKVKMRGRNYTLYEDATKDVENFITEWLKSCEKMKEEGLLTEAEIEYALYATGHDNKVELKIGDFVHRAHVDLEKRTAEYYGADEKSGMVIKRLFEDLAGCVCEIRNEAVLCSSCADMRRVAHIFGGLRNIFEIVKERGVEGGYKFYRELIERIS